MNIDHSRKSPNFSDRRGHSIRCLLLHSTEGAYAGAISWLCNPASKVSAHYVVARDGRVAQLVDVNDKAWHAGVAYYEGETDVNAISIGIEQEHYDQRDDWPTVQIQATADLCAQLIKDVGGLSVDNIVSHASVARPPGRKIDPFNYPWTLFRSLLPGSVQITEPPPEAPSAWAISAQAWAMAEGITDGANPKHMVTREEVWTMLYRMKNKGA